MLDTDTRQLRRRPDGLYKTSASKSICGHCALSTLCSKADRSIDACNLFMPAIPFVGDEGMERIFNTVRIGMAWTQRLLPGQTIALYDTKLKAVFGHARVLYLASGMIGPMLNEHAHNNHLMLTVDKTDAARELLTWQRRMYGPHIVHAKAKLTAIYLQRSDAFVTEGYFAQHEEGWVVEGGLQGAGQDSDP